MNKLYTAVKGATAVVLIGVSVALFAGVCGTPSEFIMGAIVVTGAGFLAFDTGAMAKELNRLHKENVIFTANNSAFSDENVKLKDSIKSFEAACKDMQDNNTQLTLNVVLLRDQNMLLVKLKTEFETAMDSDRKIAADLKVSVNKMSSDLHQQEHQIQNLLIVQNQAKHLIASLMTAGDDFKDFGSTLMASIDRIDNTSTAIGVLLNKLSDGKFMEIDTNADGVITPDELKSWAKKSTV